MRSNSTVDTSQMDAQSARGVENLELIRPMPSAGLDDYMFNDQTDFDINVTPGTLQEEFETFNANAYENKLTIEANEEKKYLMISQVDEENEMNNLRVKIKFFNLT